MSRTEIEVAADTVLALLTAGIVPTHMRARATDTAGLMPGDLEAAVQRRRKRGFVAPRRVGTVKTPELQSVAPLAPVVSMKRPGGNRSGGARSRQPAPEATTMRCGRCDESKTIAAFDLRADRPGVRWTVCNQCRHRRQADRYLSVSKEKALTAARVEFVVEAGDGIVGLVCSDCGKALAVGDVVTGVTELTHARDCTSRRRKSS